METFECLLTIFGKVRLANRRDGSGEESWLPLLVGCLALRSLLPLLFFNLGLQGGSHAILPTYYGVCDTLPEFERLVGKLLLNRRYDLGDRVEWVEVDDEVLLLLKC